MNNEYYSLRDEYENDIRKDIAKEFGLEAGGYAPRPKFALTPRQAQRLVNRYPSSGEKDTYGRPIPNPKAMIIANRYLALKRLAYKG